MKNTKNKYALTSSPWGYRTLLRKQPLRCVFRGYQHQIRWSKHPQPSTYLINPLCARGRFYLKNFSVFFFALQDWKNFFHFTVLIFQFAVCKRELDFEMDDLYAIIPFFFNWVAFNSMKIEVFVRKNILTLLENF